jgi:hypothetical protein
MAGRTLAAILLLGWVGLGHAATYTVTTSADAGEGSLRAAIRKANDHAGADAIAFARAMAGQVVVPLTPLPDVTDAVTINADLRADGIPDVALDGRKLAKGYGLAVKAGGCTIAGLVIRGFPFAGIGLLNVSECVVRACHLGVNASGNLLAPNSLADILIAGGGSNRIGGSASTDRNVIGVTRTEHGAGIRITGSTGNTISGNYLGLVRAGTAVLPGGFEGTGILLEADLGPCTGNVIGGTEPGSANAMAGFAVGVNLEGVSNNQVLGNLLGLTGDGSGALPLVFGVALSAGAQGNQVGGTADGAGNRIASVEFGIGLYDMGTQGNLVQGNRIGLNVAGEMVGGFYIGVDISTGAGPNTVGGSSPAAGNVVAASDGECAVRVGYAGAGSVVRHNRIGVLPDGTPAGQIDDGVFVGDVACQITDNTIAGCTKGVWAYEDNANVAVFRNTFRACEQAVWLTANARGRLGDLGNASKADDGGNRFLPSNTWFIRNETPNAVKAEGNSFGTTVASEIDAKIWDQLDDAALGRVDYDPLQGGVHPTGVGGLAVTSAAALPTRAGAEIVFCLSAPAEVTVQVLNVAGRVVAVPAAGLPCDEGVTRLSWNRRARTGLTAPSGRYLVRIVGRDARGRERTALCGLGLR